MSARCLVPIVLLLAIAAPVAAQEARPPDPDAASDSAAVQVISLDVDRRRIEREELVASTALTVDPGEVEHLAITAGASIRAYRVELRLVGVHGLVRFRADPDRLLSAFRARESDR